MTSQQRHEAALVAQMAHMLFQYAQKHGVNFCCLTDLGDSWEFETTGSPDWTDKAADAIASFAIDQLDQHLIDIDELEEKLNEDLS